MDYQQHTTSVVAFQYTRAFGPPQRSGASRPCASTVVARTMEQRPIDQKTDAPSDERSTRQPGRSRGRTVAAKQLRDVSTRMAVKRCHSSHVRPDPCALARTLTLVRAAPGAASLPNVEREPPCRRSASVRRTTRPSECPTLACQSRPALLPHSKPERSTSARRCAFIISRSAFFWCLSMRSFSSSD